MAYTPPAPPYYGPVEHSSGSGNLPPIRIVIHCTAGGSDGQGAQGTARYFQTPEAGGSAHYITDSDETIQCAYDNVVCWHAPPNYHSLGIEMVCSLANKGQGHWTLQNHVAMMRRTAKLTAQKCLQYAIPIRKLTVEQTRANAKGICAHDDVSKAFGQSSHWDPGPYFPWTTFIAMVKAEAAAINVATAPAVKAPADAPRVTGLSTGAMQYAARNPNMSGVWGAQRLQAMSSLTVLGCADTPRPPTGTPWDVHFRAAWKKWQLLLGFKGADADGIPGDSSVDRLCRRVGLTHLPS